MTDSPTSYPATDTPAGGLTPTNLRAFYIFVASPGDVQAERQAVRTFVDKFNRNQARFRGLRFEVVDWENYSSAGVGRPQELITQQTLERFGRSLALVIGIMAQRFGSPTGTHESGTEEEFEWAVQSWRSMGYPEVKWYFRDVGQLQLDPDSAKLAEGVEQWEKVKTFRTRMNTIEPRLYTRGYGDLEAFVELLDQDLGQWLNAPERPWWADTARFDISAGVRDSLGERRRQNISVHGREMVRREGKIDEVVDRLMDGSTVRLVSVRGAGGVGKTILAEQVCRDHRVVETFPGGTWKVRVGERPDVERTARELYRIVTGRDATGNVAALVQLPEAFTRDRTLVLLDDVWAPDDVARQLFGALPDEVSVLITTRGLSIPGSESVDVDELTAIEARRLLLGASSETAGLVVVDAADDLIGVLGAWAMLVDMAARLLAADLTAAPDATAQSIRSLTNAFRHDPTRLDDESSRDRSFTRMLERSISALTNVERDRFTRLSMFPPAAQLDHEVLADAWECDGVSARKTKHALERVGLSRALLDPPRLSLHDLVTSWLHHTSGRPGTYPDWHLACLHHVMDVDGRPSTFLTEARATWLFHHLYGAQAWDMLASLPTMSWREAFLDATGSDELFLDELWRYSSVACTSLDAPNAAREVARTTIFVAYVRGIVGRWPVPLLITMSLLGSPSKALRQAALHPRHACAAIAGIVQALPDGPGTDGLLDHALQLVIDQREDWLCTRSPALGTVIGRVVARDVAKGEPMDRVVSQYAAVDTLVPSDVRVGIAKAIADVDHATASRLLDEAEQLALAMPKSEDLGNPNSARRDWALARVVSRIASLDPTDPDVVSRAVAITKKISGYYHSCAALRDVVTCLARHNPPDRGLLSAAESLARTIDEEESRIEARAEIAPALAGLDSSDKKLVARAVRMARAIPRHEAYAVTRGCAIAGVATKLEATRPAYALRLLNEAETVVKTIRDDAKRWEGLATLVAQVAPVFPTRARELVEEAATEAMLYGEKAGHTEVLAKLALGIYPIDPARARQLFDQARGSISSVVNVDQESEALATMSRLLSASDASNPEAIRRATLLARSIPERDVGTRIRALDDIAKQLARHDRELADELFAEATDLAEPAKLAERIARSDPTDPAVVSRALDLANDLSGEQRASSLAGIAAYIAASEPGRSERLFAAAEDALADMADDSDGIRDEALAYVAVRRLASNAINPTAISSAETRVAGLHSWVRLRALADIVEEILADVNLDRPCLDEALRLAQSIADNGDGHIGSRALAAVGVRLVADDPAESQRLLDRARALAGRSHHYSRAHALAYVAGCQRDLQKLRSLLTFDVEVGQTDQCLRILHHFVEGAERADTQLAAGVCTGTYLAMFERTNP